MKYWVWSDNKAAGPYSAEELGRLPAVGPKTLIRRSGTPDQGWTPLDRMPSLMQFLSEAWAKDGPPPPPPILCQKCGSAVDDDAVYCDHCGGPKPHEPVGMDDEPRREDLPPPSSFGKPASSIGDVGNLVGAAVLVVVGFILMGAMCATGGDESVRSPGTTTNRPPVPQPAYEKVKYEMSQDQVVTLLGEPSIKLPARSADPVERWLYGARKVSEGAMSFGYKDVTYDVDFFIEFIGGKVMTTQQKSRVVLSVPAQ